MAVRGLRAARLRRVDLGRTAFVGLACAVYLAAAVVATWPAIQHADSRFLARFHRSGHGLVVPGDYLQANYHLWLVGHQIESGRAPWIDPYSFQPETSPRLNFGGWPFGLPYWPVEAAFGPVIAWNLLILFSYLAAGLFTLAWLRQLGLGRGAALVGGLAFALGPYRVAQSTGHFRGPISILLPLALFAFERSLKGSRWWLVLAGAALGSIPFSDIHLALAAVPFFLLYVILRTFRRPRELLGGVAAGLAGVGASLLVAGLTIPGSITGGGRSLQEVALYSAEAADFVTRHVRTGVESFVFLGWLTPLLAIAGLAVLIWTRRYALAVALGIGALVPVLLALGTNLPLYSTLWRHFPPLRFPRVPERLMPVAVLCIAALVAFAVSKVPSRLVVPAVVLVALFFDLHVRLYHGLPDDPDNQAYAALRGAPPGRLAELPVFLPGRSEGSVYLYYDMQVSRERPGGYSTVAPKSADDTARRLRPLNCGDWSVHPHALERLGVRYVAVHKGLFEGDVPVQKGCGPPAVRGLLAHGYRPLSSGGDIQMFVAPG
jgi:hypothetical protein